MKLLDYPKADTSIKVFTILTKELLNKYQDYTPIYTDGSKNQQGIGYAVITLRSTTKVKLPEAASIYTAELMAIKHALNIAEEECYQQTAILADSVSAIISVNNKATTRNNTILQILETHVDLTENGKRIRIIWIPSHTRITGNEKADKSAKEAITDSFSELCANCHFEDLINFTRRKLTMK